MESFIKKALRSPSIAQLIDLIRQKKTVSVSGIAGSFFSFLAAIIKEHTRQPLLIVCDSPAEAEKVTRDLNTFLTQNAYYFPWREDIGEESILTNENTAERFFILEKLNDRKTVPVIVAAIKSLSEKIISPHYLQTLSLHFVRKQTVHLTALARQLIDLGYERTDMVEIRGEYSVRGGIIDIYPLSHELPVRIELYGDTIESIRTFNTQSQMSLNDLAETTIVPARELPFIQNEPDTAWLIDYFTAPPLIIFSEFKEIKKKALLFPTEGPSLSFKDIFNRLQKYQKVFLSTFPCYAETDTEYPSVTINHKLFADLQQDMPLSLERREMVVNTIRSLLDKNNTVVITCNNDGEKQRLQEILNLKSPYLIFMTGIINEGFFYPDLQLVIVSDQEIFSRYKIQRSKRLVSHGFDVKDFNKIQEGDYIVHANHGIGKFLGIQRLEKNGEEKEFLTIEYAEESKLYVPLEDIALLERYIGLKDKIPQLSKLGSAYWNKTKAKIARAISDIAAELLEIQAERNSRTRPPFSKDTPWQYEFEKAFIYEETPDQMKAIEEIKKDMESEKPMDRLICGDVGFGKTEVAIRASFKAVMDGKQVAVLVPTTVLALQHYKTFQDRLADYPITIEMLSRFRTVAEQHTILNNLKAGSIDIIIGTHRLIQNDVIFKDLGLIIIDEEQRFGVAHKDKFKQLRRLVDVLTLTATPIPRTLYMSLSGIKDLSIINTPPQDRLPIETIVTDYSEDLIQKAIVRELNRDGQVYFIHNRVESIEKMKETLMRLVPKASISTAHGQMQEKELSEIMNLFILRKIDILVCTTIIESGIDIPNVNTIIINRADRFGLSDLYQLRGRVGRYKHRAYAYFLLPQDTVILSIAKKRLKAINDYTSLGSGLKIAVRDLEIRGAGNILGKDQHGHIYTIGFDLYCKLLKESVEKLKGISAKTIRPEPTIRLPFSLQLPLDYIPYVQQRIEIYKKLYFIEDDDAVNRLRQELRDRFGKLPNEVQAILEKSSLKVWLLGKGITSLEIKQQHLILFKEGRKYIFKLEKGLNETSNPFLFIQYLRNYLNSFPI